MLRRQQIVRDLCGNQWAICIAFQSINDCKQRIATIKKATCKAMRARHERMRVNVNVQREKMLRIM